MTPARVALIGVHGHGVAHLRTLEALRTAGVARTVALCDVRPIPADQVPADAVGYTDHREMLAGARPDVTIVCTPPHTHLPIALDAARAGSDLLLEKPPVVALAEQRVLAQALAATGRRCQVGFQSLGSGALAALLDAVAAGGLGTLTRITATAAWIRDDAYYARARWAGHRHLDGRVVADGALTNPFAHAVMNCLAVAAAADPGTTPVRVETELYRCRPIATDDTSCLRVTTSRGPGFLVAVTLCAEKFAPPRVVVTGTRGRAVLDYADDRLWLPGDVDPRPVPDRVPLLANLVAHRADPAGVPLLAPLARVAPFTAVLEAVLRSPDPVAVDEAYLRAVPEGGSRRVVLSGVNDAVEAAGRTGATFSELGAAWAVAGPHAAPVDPTATEQPVDPAAAGH
ncbi:Gfo/Idh/MocA family protein [Planosporangium sp. 12N6]|uniref:Gfo/Idh/MocA family protein n=1 Tax=Planosporangium spinosum TaxID=3402278 RepID=UPI003CE75588